MVKLKINLRNADRMRREVSRGGRFVSRFRVALGQRYESFLQQRYDLLSKGGGEWPPLKKEYLDWKVKHGLSSLILVATGQARDDFRIAGALKRVPTDNGVQISLNVNKRSGRILSYHQSTRPVLVGPDGGTRALMTGDAKQAFDEAMSFARKR